MFGLISTWSFTSDQVFLWPTIYLLLFFFLDFFLRNIFKTYRNLNIMVRGCCFLNAGGSTANFRFNIRFSTCNGFGSVLVKFACFTRGTFGNSFPDVFLHNNFAHNHNHAYGFLVLRKCARARARTHTHTHARTHARTRTHARKPKRDKDMFIEHKDISIHMFVEPKNVQTEPRQR